MSKKKRVFIISHSHWDREWYMPFEQHHMRLVTLVDNLLDLFKNDPDFNSFHLDGQMIALDDYLAVRPEKKAAVAQAIKAGKLKIGPFYILQDDFLISPESNVRNMLIGKKEAEKYGKRVELGYFPDTFGNMGQTPQMMQLADLPAAAFGRGVTPTGFNNQVQHSGKYASNYSEMWWQGPDGSRILGLLFANWYSNGNEIPVDRVLAKQFWDQKLADAERFAATDNLLMMNGVDHQPVQQNISAAIKVANELYPDYEFIHSNFPDYLAALKDTLPKNLSTIKGELTSQETDGWYTLANTASSRVYLKQTNTKVERLLENVAEPLATMAYPATKYPTDRLTYAWKLLLQNHPHDSICGCSVDPVHREMMTRFAKAEEVGKFVADEALHTFANQVDTSAFPKGSRPFVVVNTAGSSKTDLVQVEIEWARRNFSEEGTIQEQRQALEEIQAHLPELTVINSKGESITAEVIGTDVGFKYDLPKDRFRVAYQALTVTVQLNIAQLPAFSWETFALVAKATKPQSYAENVSFDDKSQTIINPFYSIKIETDGSLSITNLQTQRVYRKQLVFEDTGDMGNEYIYRQTADNKAILSTDFPIDLQVLQNDNLAVKIRIKQIMQIPAAATHQLTKEQQRVVDITQRTATRTSELKPLTIMTDITVLPNSKRIRFTTNLTNEMRDHRLRVLFPTGLSVKEHAADSIFETVTRPNRTAKSWKNSTNPQHQQSFVTLHDDKNGIVISNFGLNEYEVLAKQQTIAVTLLRAVGEMGDWGYFPTPEAQCQRAFTFSYGLELTDGSEKAQLAANQHAHTAQVPLSVAQTTVHKGPHLVDDSYLSVDGSAFIVTSLKRAEESDGVTIRGYNALKQKASIQLDFPGHEGQTVNFFEEPVKRDLSQLEGNEIRTYLFTADQKGTKHD